MELNRDNKFDKENIKEIDLMKLELEDVEDLMTAKREVAFKDTKYCLNCKHIFNINDYRFEEEELCPYCHSDNYGDCYQDDLDTNTYETHINNVEDIREDVGDEIYNKICYMIDNSDEYEELADYYRTKNYDLKKEGAIKQMGKKQNLEEATIKALYDGLKDNTEIDDVEGLVDDVLVVTDPEITTDEYNEVIERAEEIIEDTPEGEIPLDPTYLGEYLQICPICGGSFIEDHILEPGTACPICFETPESFVMVGKLQAEEVVAEDNGLEGEEDVTGEEEFTPTPIDELGEEETGEEEETLEPEEEPVENGEEPVETEERPRGARTRRNREVASKEIPSGNKLTEKLEEKKDPEEGFDIDTELADTINGVHIGEITATYKPDTNTVVFFNAETGEDLDTIIYRNQTPEEIEEYMTSEAGLGLKKEAVHHKSSFKVKKEEDTEEDTEEDVKEDDKELLLGAEEDDKEYTIEEVGEDKIKELADKSAFTWEGAFTTDEALQKIVDDFKESTPIQLPVHFYTWKGKLFNEIYGLTGSNAYPDDLNFLSVDLDNWSEMGNLPIFKMKVRARWLDDIVDNNAVRQNEIDSKND